MEVVQRVRVACPRCGAAVTGDFKFCPTCAYRLRPGVAPVEPVSVARPRSLASTLLAVCAALFVVLIAGIGFWIFRDQEAVRPTQVKTGFATALPVEGLTAANVRKYLRRVPPGIAYYFTEETDDPEAQPGPLVPMWVDDLDVLIYEVTRSFYAEFLADMRVRVRRGDPTLPSLATIWNANPKDEDESRYAKNYLNTWLYRYLSLQRLAPEQRRPLPDYVLAFLSEEARKELALLPKEKFADPILAFVEVMPFPWPQELGLLLLAPPSWVRVNEWAEFVVEMPHETGALPVTEVAWSDARAFTEWLTLRVGGSVKLRLPMAGEWTRIAHGNHPPRGTSDETAWDFPWGKSMLRHACNNAELYGHTRDPVLQPVGLTYRDKDAAGAHDGTTVDGIFDMSGNAAEWVLDEGDQSQRVNGVYRVHYDAEADRHVSIAPTFGGSYRLDLTFCRVRSLQMPYKWARDIDVGFRLVAEPVL